MKGKMTGDVTETKVCPFCAETIKAAAKVCPFCRSKQGRFVLLRQELLVAVPALLLIIGAIVFLAVVLSEVGAVTGRSFSKYRSDLAVANASLVPDTVGKSDFWLSGVVTNRGEHPWRISELEIQFLDGQSNLLDVRHCEIKDSFAIQPHHDHGFRVGVGEVAFTNSSITHQVSVQMATDADIPPKTDE